MITQPSGASADSACSIDFSCACTVATSSPMKQVSYYSIERNDCMSSPMKSKRFSTTKESLVFDGSEMTPSDILTSEQDMNAPGNQWWLKGKASKARALGP
ncbi:hypothetical protein Tco_1325542 [Tanacetum coccineum]